MRKLFFIPIILLASLFSGVSAQQSSREYGYSQKAEEGLVAVYPNPAKDFVFIKAKDVSIAVRQVTLYSILGMQVADFFANANTAEINLDKLRPGKYLMKYLLSDGTQKVTQIIKQ